ncbi:MAG: helix-turn-helix transcriptional regulator [Alphaproteobacteria bacterium]|jgi:DNA-binding CsgD family transcriptional regulator|nr:helix-turn-helix transcriptional regulator [Alphaproteobacteria bacterium]
MNLTLDSNHSLYGLTPQVQDFFNDFAMAQEFSYFQYARMFHDGSTLLLLNRVDIFNKFMDLGFGSYSSIREEDKSRCSYSFFWDEDLPEDPVSVGRSFHVYNGMTLLRRSRHYYDMIAFARQTPCDRPGGFYLTRIGALENFAHSFETKFGHILNEPEPHLIKPPVHQQDPNRDLICLGNKGITIQGRMGETHLTPREIDCLQLWARHLTMKEIGKHLQVSPRTVETIFNRARMRSGYSLRELVTVLAICP